MSDKDKDELKKLFRINSMLSAGLKKSEVAKRIGLHPSTLARKVSKIQNDDFSRRKKYDSKSRFVIEPNEKGTIMEFLAFNKFTSLKKIIEGCHLGCSESTLSKFFVKNGKEIV